MIIEVIATATKDDNFLGSEALKSLSELPTASGW
jgi:hypothetical protein